jgi:hypothetical protein
VAAEQVEQSVLDGRGVGKPCRRPEVPSGRQSFHPGGHLQRVIDVQNAGKVPAMDCPLTDPHAEQPHRRQLTCWVLDRAVQDAGLTEGGDQLGRAALELFKRVIPDLIVSEMKKALLALPPLELRPGAV